MAITATVVDPTNSATTLGGRVVQRLKVVGATGIVGDTSVVTLPQIGKDAMPMGGVFAKSAETLTKGGGSTITLKALVALGNDTVYLSVAGSLI